MSQSGAPSAGDYIALCPFTIVRDSNEGHPFPFLGLKTRKSEGAKPLVIKTVQKPLYATSVRDVQVGAAIHSVGLADYSIEGMEHRIQIERKSIADLFGTLGDRRGRFEAEIKRLHEDCEFAAVVVEGGWSQISRWQGNGPKPDSVTGTIVAWMQRYRNVSWILADSRSIAEKLTYRALERFYSDHLNQAG